MLNKSARPQKKRQLAQPQLWTSWHSLFFFKHIQGGSELPGVLRPFHRWRCEEWTFQCSQAHAASGSLR